MLDELALLRVQLVGLPAEAASKYPRSCPVA
jgi:ABC-type transporter Mla maintaining outer membrane lipid asymmetry ATPase subunit MlaF